MLKFINWTETSEEYSNYDIHTRFDKMKKVSEGGVISNGDLENPSEEDQLKWALEQSLNTNSDSKNDFNATSDQIKCDGDVSKLSEEDQLKLALGKLM